jgi:hypothetical protein
VNTKTLVSLSLLVGIGAVLHTIVPPILFGMKPDMLLTMMFLGILLFPNLKSVLLLGLTTGAMSALTTGFPGGQISNMIDKPITALVFFAFVVLVKKLAKSTITAVVLTGVGTIVSGFIFLSTAFLLVGLPGEFSALVKMVVLPASLVNMIVMAVVYPIVLNVLKRTNIQTEASA